MRAFLFCIYPLILIMIRKISILLKFMREQSSRDFNQYSYQSAPLSQSMIKTTSQKFSISKKKTKIHDKPIPDPSATLNKLLAWRAVNKAPVDTAGCEVLADPKQSPEIQKYQKLVALMLSVQTKDQTTAKVMGRLKQYGLNPENISKMEQKQLTKLIYESNFNQRKAKSIIEVSKRVLAHGLPSNKKDLMQYPGVGIKIATIYMRCAEGVNDGIGVDTHVHRISNLLGWVDTGKDPQKTQIALQNLFPKQQWQNINLSMVGFGQTICDAKRPKCSQCPLAQDCPSFDPQF